MVIDGLGGHTPGTGDARPRQPAEVKLAAHLGVGAAGVGDVVAVERHEVGQDLRGGAWVCGGGKEKKDGERKKETGSE